MDDNYQCTIQLCIEKIVKRINRLGVVTKPSNGSPAKTFGHFRGDLSDVTRRENEDNNITMLDDRDGQSHRGSERVKSDVHKLEKHLNDLQEILNIVVDLVRCSTNENLSRTTIDFLRTFSTTIKQQVKNILDTCTKSLTHEEKTGKRPQTNVGLKRAREIDECVVENNVSKKSKTDDEHNDSLTTTSVGSFVERNSSAAKESIENYLRTRKTFEPTATARTENSNVQTRKFELSRLVVNELDPYYKKNHFVSKDLFQFMAKSIVHKLLDSIICPDEHTVKSMIWQMMVKTKIESKVQILKLLKHFF